MDFELLEAYVSAVAELADDEIPCCRPCAEDLNEGSPADFECLACGKPLCRLCADLHVQEEHPLPYEARVRAEMVAEDRARSLFSILLAVAGMAGTAVVLWPYLGRFFELYRQPRVLAAVAILAVTSLAIRFAPGLLTPRRPS